MVKREKIIEKIKRLPEKELKKVAEFLEELEKKDPLAEVIGICEGPPDLAKRHEKYVYGKSRF